MISQAQIIEIINEKLEADGYFLVSADVKPSNQIMIFIDGENGVPIEYCVQISRLIENSFDREAEDFSIEVSSAGIGQPFKVPRQYQKNIGRTVEVLTPDSKKITGVLTEVTNTGFVVKEEKMVKPEGKKKKELQVFMQAFNFEEVKYVKEIIKF
jgi:ribosome maturation factor RimP